MLLDAVVIGAADLPSAVHDFALLLQVEPESSSASAARFALSRGAVELIRAADGLQALRLIRRRSGSGGDDRATEVAGLPIEWLEPAGEGAAVRDSSAQTAPEFPSGIDHVVVNTLDPDRAIRIWGNGLGLRLALDRVFAARGLRLQFFRTTNRVTLEFASPYPALPSSASSDDRLHGVSFRVADLRSRHEALSAAGFDVSEIRDGMKPGTLVCTVRDRTCGVPTLLIQQPAPPVLVVD